MSVILAVAIEQHRMRKIQVNLERRGYEVYCALTSTQVQEQLGKAKPDLILFDITTRSPEDPNILRKLKLAAYNEDIPIRYIRQRDMKPGFFSSLPPIEYLEDDGGYDDDGTWR
jgi:PleD family two-component response regulator